MKLAILLAFTACAAEAPAPSYDCAMNYNCDGELETSFVPLDADEAEDALEDWTDACHAIAVRDVEAGRCKIVVCGAICYPEDRSRLER